MKNQTLATAVKFINRVKLSNTAKSIFLELACESSAKHPLIMIDPYELSRALNKAVSTIRAGVRELVKNGLLVWDGLVVKLKHRLYRMTFGLPTKPIADVVKSVVKKVFQKVVKEAPKEIPKAIPNEVPQPSVIPAQDNSEHIPINRPLRLEEYHRGDFLGAPLPDKDTIIYEIFDLMSTLNIAEEIAKEFINKLGLDRYYRLSRKYNSERVLYGAPREPLKWYIKQVTELAPCVPIPEADQLLA